MYNRIRPKCMLFQLVFDVYEAFGRLAGEILPNKTVFGRLVFYKCLQHTDTTHTTSCFTIHKRTSNPTVNRNLGGACI